MVYSNRRRDSRPSTSVVPTRRTRTSGLWPVRSEWCPVRILSGGNHGSRMTTPSPARWFRKQRSVCATRSSVFTYPMELKETEDDVVASGKMKIAHVGFEELPGGVLRSRNSEELWIEVETVDRETMSLSQEASVFARPARDVQYSPVDGID